MNTIRLAAVLVLAVSCMTGAARAETLISVSGEFGPEPDSKIQSFPFEVRDDGADLFLNTSADLTQGLVMFRVIDPDGKQVNAHGGGTFTVGRQPVRTQGRTGTLRMEVAPDGAVGPWSGKVFTAPPKPPAYSLLVPGVGMMLVGVAAVLVCKGWSGAKWRWFWVGAGVWTVGVALKFGFAVALNGPILSGLKQGLPPSAYLAAGSLYIGLLTGIFEIAITLAAALIWKRMARDAARGVAVGVGAGAFEALLLGLISFGTIVVALAGTEAVAGVLAAAESSALVTPLPWLVGPVERVIAILCHTSSRALTLLAVARRRWDLFLGGFLVMTAIDAIAGWAHLSGYMGRGSVWWLELAIAPFAILSIPVIVWCVRKWPEAEPAQAGPAPAPPRQEAP